jgi:hypothetical protein
MVYHDLIEMKSAGFIINRMSNRDYQQLNFFARRQTVFLDFSGQFHLFSISVAISDDAWRGGSRMDKPQKCRVSRQIT